MRDAIISQPHRKLSYSVINACFFTVALCEVYFTNICLTLMWHIAQSNKTCVAVTIKNTINFYLFFANELDFSSILYSCFTNFAHSCLQNNNICVSFMAHVACNSCLHNFILNFCCCKLVYILPCMSTFASVAYEHLFMSSNYFHIIYLLMKSM